MAQTSTPETAARFILGIAVHQLGLGAGETIPCRSLLLPFSQHPWDSSDLQGGLSFAIQSGWLVPTARDSFRLTDVGFSEA